MLTEPNIERNFISSRLEDDYGLKVTTLTFVQGGECSWGYKVETERNGIYFFKIHTDLKEHILRFRLTDQLFNECNIKNISHPIKTSKGNITTSIGKYPATLFDFISGHTAATKQLSEKQRFGFGELLGNIHRAKNIIGDFQVKEDFFYENTPRLLENIEKANELINNSSKYKKNVAKLLLENKEKIVQRLQILESLGDRLRNKKLDFVICHGEPHKWNTMVNEEGEVFLIDWDDCLFAPKEKDLKMIREDEVMLAGYKHVFGNTDCDEDVIQYYFLEWNISEIDAWSTSVFYTESNDRQNEHFIDEFITDLKELNDGIT